MRSWWAEVGDGEKANYGNLTGRRCIRKEVGQDYISSQSGKERARGGMYAGRLF